MALTVVRLKRIYFFNNGNLFITGYYLYTIKNPQLSGLNNFNSRVCFSKQDKLDGCNWIFSIEINSYLQVLDKKK